MPSFTATYLKPNGARRTERIEAVDRSSLEVYLRRSRRVHPLRIVAVGERSRRGVYRFRVKTAILLSQLDSMEVLLMTGVTISEVLRTLVERTPPGKLRFLWAELAAQIEVDGKLGPPMRKFPGVFSEAACGLIEAGEASGNLPEAVASVRLYLAQINRVQQAAARAAIYPAMVVGLGTVSLAVLMLFTLPRFAMLLRDLAVKKMNPLSAFLFGLSDRVTKHTVVVAMATAAVPIIIVGAFKTQMVRRLITRIAMRVPQIKEMLWSLALARICMTFSTIYEQGVGASEILPLCEKVAGNPVVAERMARVTQLVRENKTVGEAFDAAGGFPMEIVLAVRNGESNLARVVRRMGEYYATLAEHQVEVALKLIEPLLILAVVLFAGLVLLGMFLPLISVVQNLSNP